MNNIKVIVSDLDGTLINDQGELGQVTIDTFLMVQKFGIRCVIATGRELDTAIHYAKLLHLDKYGGFIVAFNGQMVFDFTTNQVHTNQIISPEVSQAIYRFVKRNQFYAVFENHEINYIVRPLKLRIAKMVYDWIQKIIKVPLVEPIATTDKRDIAFISSASHINKPISKIGLRWSGFYLKQKQIKLIRLFQDEITFSMVDYTWVDLIPKGVNKAVGLSKIAEWINVPLDQFMAFGNAENDKEMLTSVGIGYAMANSMESLKQYVPTIDYTNNQEGVAKMITELLKESDL